MFGNLISKRWLAIDTMIILIGWVIFGIGAAIQTHIVLKMTLLAVARAMPAGSVFKRLGPAAIALATSSTLTTNRENDADTDLPTGVEL